MIAGRTVLGALIGVMLVATGCANSNFQRVKAQSEARRDGQREPARTTPPAATAKPRPVATRSAPAKPVPAKRAPSKPAPARSASPAEPATAASSAPRPVTAATPVRMLDPVDQLVIVQSSQVTVEPGDTLFALSRRSGADISDLVAANALQPPYALQAGQKLAVPPLRYHIVNPGESGLVIARRYGVEWPLIARMNELQAPYTVRAGQRLRLPPVLDAAQRAAQFDVVIAAASAPPAARPPAARPPAVRPPAPVPKPEPDLSAHQPPPQKPPAAVPVAAKPAGETASAPEPAKPESAGPPSPAESSPVAGQPVATAEARPAPLPDSGPFTGRMSWPLDGRILSGFGAKGGGQYNDGINIAARKGQTVKAASDGVIAYVGDAIVSFGNLVLIKHGQGWVTAYAHLDEVLVKRGDKVRAGEPIGKAGETGNVDRPQLHFEVREGKRARDPVLILPRRSVG